MTEENIRGRVPVLVGRDTTKMRGDQVSLQYAGLVEFRNVLPLCFGGYGEGSEEVHNLISSLADARLKKVGLQRGRAGSDQELAIINSQLRRRISSATIRANYTLLLERMAQVGAGAGRAETRREWVRAEEERMKRDREAQWLARVRGVGLVHKGRFFG